MHIEYIKREVIGNMYMKHYQMKALWVINDACCDDNSLITMGTITSIF